MSILDLLLETSSEKLSTKVSKDVEITRLSAALGTPCVITCLALTNEQVGHIGEISKTTAQIKLNTISEGIRLEGKKLSNKKLMEKFGAASPLDLLEKLFLPGELYELYATVNQLSGYGVDAVAEIKN